MNTPIPWREPDYDNDTGPNDGGFSEFWTIRGVARFDNETDAKLCVRAVNSHQALVEALEAVVTELSAYYDGANDENADDNEALTLAANALKLAKA